MSARSSAIPDEAITQIYAGSRIWYRLATNPPVTVTCGKTKEGTWAFLCHTHRTTDQCEHTRAVRRYCNQPMTKTEDAA